MRNTPNSVAFFFYSYFYSGQCSRRSIQCAIMFSFQWCHNERDRVSNHQPHHRLLNCLFWRGSEKTSKLHVTGLCGGIDRWPVNSPHKWPVTWKMFPFDDIILLGRDAQRIYMHLTHSPGTLWYRDTSTYILCCTKIILNQIFNMICICHAIYIDLKQPKQFLLAPILHYKGAIQDHNDIWIGFHNAVTHCVHIPLVCTQDHLFDNFITHWGWVTYICVIYLDRHWPVWRQATIWTNTDILSITC